MKDAAAPTRWTKLRIIAEQQAYFTSPHRFNVLPCGRRSGKTELAKRKVVLRALTPPGEPGGSLFNDPQYFCAAPTRDQAKRIYWEDLKRLIPKKLIRKNGISETELRITTVMNSSISVVGLDKPERIEGSPWDGGILDEYANMKAQAWGANVRPALSDRHGWCDLIGVPEGRNHYYTTVEMAKAEMADKGAHSEWGYFHWFSSLILPPEEIASAKATLDELTFQQEYEGSFVNFLGRAYYAFTDKNKGSLRYDPNQAIGFCFDFNVDPGIAVIVQEQALPSERYGTGVIGEVYIPQNSNTEMVCRRLVEDWGTHQGEVRIYGDASGGMRRTSATTGSDWDIVMAILKPVFGDRLKIRVPRANPGERGRVNAMNTRCKNAAGDIRLVVDARKAPKTAADLDGVRLVEGGSGEIDKHYDKTLTHLSDALGYYIFYEFSGGGAVIVTRAYYGG